MKAKKKKRNKDENKKHTKIYKKIHTLIILSTNNILVHANRDRWYKFKFLKVERIEKKKERKKNIIRKS